MKSIIVKNTNRATKTILGETIKPNECKVIGEYTPELLESLKPYKRSGFIVRVDAIATPSKEIAEINYSEPVETVKDEVKPINNKANTTESPKSESSNSEKKSNSKEDKKSETSKNSDSKKSQETKQSSKKSS